MATPHNASFSLNSQSYSILPSRRLQIDDDPVQSICDRDNSTACCSLIQDMDRACEQTFSSNIELNPGELCVTTSACYASMQSTMDAIEDGGLSGGVCPAALAQAVTVVDVLCTQDEGGDYCFQEITDIMRDLGLVGNATDTPLPDNVRALVTDACGNNECRDLISANIQSTTSVVLEAAGVAAGAGDLVANVEDIEVLYDLVCLKAGVPADFCLPQVLTEELFLADADEEALQNQLSEAFLDEFCIPCARAFFSFAEQAAHVELLGVSVMAQYGCGKRPSDDKYCALVFSQSLAVQFYATYEITGSCGRRTRSPLNPEVASPQCSAQCATQMEQWSEEAECCWDTALAMWENFRTGEVRTSPEAFQSRISESCELPAD